MVRKNNSEVKQLKKMRAEEQLRQEKAAVQIQVVLG
jgi:DNA-binding XRE family transcriptional regulator